MTDPKMFSMDWCMKMAGLEGNAEIGAGKLAADPVLQCTCGHDETFHGGNGCVADECDCQDLQLPKPRNPVTTIAQLLAKHEHGEHYAGYESSHRELAEKIVGMLRNA